jgi:serpin B
MQEALHLSASGESVHAMFGQIDAALGREQTNGNLMVMANSLWPPNRYPLLGDYASLLKRRYRSSITPVNYIGQSEQARATINQWVEEKTGHKIDEAIPRGQPQ